MYPYQTIAIKTSLSKVHKYFDQCIPGVIIADNLNEYNMIQLKALCHQHGIRLITQTNGQYTDENNDTISPGCLYGIWFLSPLVIVQDRKRFF